MRVWITGTATGQLHHELLRSCPGDATLVMPQARLDLTDEAALEAHVMRVRPDVIINAAAYTAVDKAESEVDAAFAVNARAVSQLAGLAAGYGAHLLHVSTDFVFGRSNGKPFATDAAVDPQNVYGQSKLGGEQAVSDQLPDQGLVMRTAWVYSAHGNNFVKTMLRLMREREELGVVADQIGAPTWAHALAQALWRAAERRAHGTLHWTGAGVASWYDFACAIHDEAHLLGLLERPVTLRPLTTAEFPTPAARPAYSVLESRSTCDALDLPAAHWRCDLRRMLEELM